MLGLSRTGARVARLSRHRRAFSAALAHASTPSSSGRSSMSRDGRSNNRNNNNNNNKFGTAVAKEQIQLQNKYKTSLENTKLDSLYDVIELVEWRGNVYNPVLNKVVELTADATSALGALTDRQLAVVLSVFGNKGDSTGRSRRNELLNKSLEAIQGRGVALGPLARDAVLAARLDNGESVNVVEELQKWEAAGLTPSSDTYQHVARAYAVQGNTQGIVDIINHMKQEGLVVSQSLIESMIQCVSRNGNYKQAETLLLKFLPAMNEVALRCALAIGAVARGDALQVVSTLNAMSGTAKPNIADNNVLILQVLFEMLEAGIPNAVELMRPFLTTVPDNSTLTEWHHNSGVIARARRARAEGMLDAALSMYSIVNPNFKNKNLEDQFVESLGYQLRQHGSDIEKIISTSEHMENAGILSDHLLFLLEASVSFGSDHLKTIFAKVKEAGKLHEYLMAQPSLKRSLAKRLSNDLASSVPSSISDRAASIADVATVLFSPRTSEDSDHMSDFYPIVYALGGKDVAIVPKVLELLDDARSRKEYATAILSSILVSKEDPLKKDKLMKLVECPKLDLNLWHTTTQHKLIRLINHSDKLLEVEEQMKLVAKIISLSFPAADSTTRGSSIYAAKNLGLLVASDSLSIDKVTSLVDALENEANVSLSFDDLESLKSAVKDSSKLEALGRLKRSHQTNARWKAASIEELESELEHLTQSGKAKAGLLNTVQNIILQKILVQKPANLLVALRHLTAVSEIKTKDTRLRTTAGRVFDMVFTVALLNGNTQTMSDLWKVKPSFTAVHALSYIAVMFTKGEIEKADAVCEELRKSAQFISNRALSMAGEAVGEIEKAKMDELTAYLTEKFNLKSMQSRKLVEQVKMRQLKNLIQEGNLVDAMELAKEESSAAGAAFGQFELFAAAFKAGDSVFAKNIYNMVLNTHDKNIAVLDFAFAALEAGKTKQAAKLFETNGLTISTPKLQSYMIRCTHSGRVDVMHGLFSGLCAGERADTVAINQLLLQTLRMYYQANDYESPLALKDEVRQKSVSTEKAIQRIFDDLETKQASSKAPVRESAV